MEATRDGRGPYHVYQTSILLMLVMMQMRLLDLLIVPSCLADRGFWLSFQVAAFSSFMWESTRICKGKVRGWNTMG